MTATTGFPNRRLLDLHPLRLVAVFTALDLLAGLLYWLHTRDILGSRFFHLSRDRGFAEIIQYVKFGLILHLLRQWHAVNPARLLGAWIALFAVMLLDDAIGLHEAGGGLILRFFAIPAPDGLRAKDLAEGLATLALEGTACLYLAFRFFQAPRPLRLASFRMGLGLVPLFICGFVLDILPLPMAEQAGEMLSMSLLLAVVHGQCRAHTRPPDAPART